MTELINMPIPAPAYDPDSTGWAPPDGPYTATARPSGARVRCGRYLHPQTGAPQWGDHRVTFPGTTCRDVSCYVSHYPYAAPGWPEPVDPGTDGYTFVDRPGARPIAAALSGWNNAGQLASRISDPAAYNIAHVVLDALRDAGFKLVAPPDRLPPCSADLDATAHVETDDPRQ